MNIHFKNGSFIAFAVCVAFSAKGATMCEGMSALVALDLATGSRTAEMSEAIRYSTAWVDGAASEAEAVIEVNGEMLSSTTGSGYVEWTPMSNGTYTLTHKVMSGGEQVGETLISIFLVDTFPDAPMFTPESKTVFDGSLSVLISCLTEDATIHYTTDGSEPTVESPVYRRFRINGKTTVKAVAEKNGLVSEVATAEYALGQCDDPLITPNDGATFEWAGEQVSISWQGEDGVLRYTTDGSDPTPTSPIYEGAFTINDSTVVKARAFGDQFF
ncbi:MAG: chitobiase/beta-hexosaminidase C-terminal domain-containing protein, partial [Kiritimatiellae bacterium]|nr:chitobiase/beta-hexosaminidase C-terminal domain-containing protein [Kiritimatiellia bacterium]